MAIPARQIGWSTKANLLWEISKQLEILTQVAGNVVITPTPAPLSNWTVVTGGEAGDGTVAQYAINGFNITGPNDNQGNGWVYIKQQFPYGANISIDYQWASADEGTSVDRPIYCIDDVEPTGIPSDINSKVGATPETGTWSNITVNPGQWFSVGIYSIDSCCGRGFLSIDVNVNWIFAPNTNVTWPANQDGYTLYTGPWTNYDDGNATDPVNYAGTFKTDNVEDTQFYLSTNGYIYGANNATSLEGNQQDLYLTPGDPLLDGDVQNFWYQNTVIGTKWKTSILVYCGHCCGDPAQYTPYSYILNIYKDEQYQYLEARVKVPIEYSGNAGVASVSQPVDILSQVWQSDLDGITWTYLGYGSIV